MKENVWQNLYKIFEEYSNSNTYLLKEESEKKLSSTTLDRSNWGRIRNWFVSFEVKNRGVY